MRTLLARDVLLNTIGLGALRCYVLQVIARNLLYTPAGGYACTTGYSVQTFNRR